MAYINASVIYSAPCADVLLLTGMLFFTDDGDIYYYWKILSMSHMYIMLSHMHFHRYAEECGKPHGSAPETT